MNAEYSYHNLIYQRGMLKSHILQVDSHLAVVWIKPGHKWLLPYVMVWFSGKVWLVLTGMDGQPFTSGWGLSSALCFWGFSQNSI